MTVIAKAKDPAYTIRFPIEVLNGVRQSAKNNGRSINSEVIWILRQSQVQSTFQQERAA